MQRRSIIAAGLWLAAAAPLGACAGEGGMYGLIGKFIAKPGQRDALISILLESTAAMPGCRSYIVAADPADPNGVWITEVWDSEADHQASLDLPQVKDAIARAMPLIEGFGEHIVTAPVGGVGLLSERS